jgi:restriction system protein
MHMRRRDVLIADIVICVAVLFIVPLINIGYWLYAFFVIPCVIIARILLQRFVYDRDTGSAPRTLRRTMFNIDPISFELYYVFITAAAVITLWDRSAVAAIFILILAAIFRILLEYMWFSDRPDRWYSFRFRIYSMRRKMNPSGSERLQKILVSEVDSMKGRDFEHYVADVLIMNGFSKVRVTKGSGDYGIDITATLEKENYAIQCKRSEAKIGIKAVQEAFLGKEHYKADIAVVVTNNYFTKQAYEAAEGKVALWDRERLGGLIRKARDSVSAEKYAEDMAASEKEIKMFAALFDRGRGDALLTEKVMGTLYPAGNVRQEEDIDHFLRRVGEYLYEKRGISERCLKKLRRALEKNKLILPFEADIACYHLTETHTITIREMSEVRSRLSKAFIEIDNLYLREGI